MTADSTDIRTATHADERTRRWAQAHPVPGWRRIEAWALVAAGAGTASYFLLGLLLAWGGQIDSPRQFFLSYLVAFVYWCGVALGCLALLMIQHLTGGGWGLALRRILEAGAHTLIPLAVLFLPVAFGVGWLYLWAQEEAVMGDPHLQHKYPYLNPVWFAIRGAGYFAVWITLALLLRHWSACQDREQGARCGRRLQVMSGPGLLAFGLAVTFAGIDWTMSLEPLWFSMVYPVMVGVGHLLAGFAFAVAVLMLLADRPPLAGAIPTKILGDLGNLLLAFVMLWAYMSLSQFLLIWVANLQEEIPWYLRRTRAGWEYLAVPLVFFHFFVPFLLLLSRDLKRTRVGLLWLAVGLLVVRAADLFWLIEPAYPHEGQYLFWLLDLAALVGVGGVCVWWFTEQLRRKPILPVGDPALAEGLSHE